MMFYVLYDPMVGSYIKERHGKPVASWHDAKKYKRLKAAISPVSGAGLMNTSRNVPSGRKPCKNYQNLPNVEVHEYDAAGNFVQSHAAPPSYIYITGMPNISLAFSHSGVKTSHGGKNVE